MRPGNLLPNSTTTPAPGTASGASTMPGSQNRRLRPQMQRSTGPYVEAPIDLKVFLLGFYLAALSSISTQFLIIYLHLPIPLIGLAQLGVTFAFLTSGKFFAFLNSRLSKFWLGLGLWWAL